MKLQNFHFELRDNTLAFANALNNIVINRYIDNSRADIEKKVNVRFVYGPKKRVLYSIINAAKTTTLPVVALDLKGFSHDPSRIFNKHSEFYDNVIYKGDNARYLTPTPIKLNYTVTVITRYRSDIEQICSNFIPFCNPYITVSLKVPEEFKLYSTQEIRSTITWDGGFNIDYPDPIANNQKSIFTANANFTMTGWLFKPEQPPSKPIYSIDASFMDNLLEELDDPFDAVHVDSYPVIQYTTVNGIPQVSENPNFTPGISNISELYIPSSSFTIPFSDAVKVFNFVGSGLNYNNTCILDGDKYNLSEIGEYEHFDTSNISTNKTPISIIKKGLNGINISKYVTCNNNVLSYSLPTNLKIGDYKFITFNESGISNPISFTII